jgi:CRP-like cAMP-binding protein
MATIRRENMQQGSSASALAARTAGMTDEQILDLDLDALANGNGGAAAPGAPTHENFGDVRERAGSPAATSGAAGTQATSAVLSGDGGREQRFADAPGGPAPNAQGDPAWLKQLEAQPAAAAEARQWREAAKDVAALDAAYFSGDSGARSGLAARLYESDPAAFREMLAESARMLSERDPQALAELARQLGMNEAQAPNAAAKSLAQAARSHDPNAAAQSQISAENRGNAGFPAEAYRAFESATNEDVARSTREAIDRTLSSTLPEGIGEGARRRIGDDIFHELHATLAADRELGRQVGEILRGWRFDGATRQQVVSLISGRARAVMPEVTRRVVAEWTSSVLASDRARAARVDTAASRRDITGGRLPEAVPASALRPRNIDYSRMSDEQILDL